MCGLFRCFQRLLENCLFFHKEVSCLLLQSMPQSERFSPSEKGKLRNRWNAGNGVVDWWVGRWAKQKGKMLLQALGWREVQGTSSSCGRVSVGLLDKRPPWVRQCQGRGSWWRLGVPISGTDWRGWRNLFVPSNCFLQIKEGLCRALPEPHWFAMADSTIVTTQWDPISFWTHGEIYTGSPKYQW